MTLVSVGKCYFLAYVCTRIEEPGKTTDKTEGEEEEDLKRRKRVKMTVTTKKRRPGNKNNDDDDKHDMK